MTKGLIAQVLRQLKCMLHRTQARQMKFSPITYRRQSQPARMVLATTAAAAVAIRLCTALSLSHSLSNMRVAMSVSSTGRIIKMAAASSSSSRADVANDDDDWEPASYLTSEDDDYESAHQQSSLNMKVVDSYTDSSVSESTFDPDTVERFDSYEEMEAMYNGYETGNDNNKERKQQSKRPASVRASSSSWLDRNAVFTGESNSENGKSFREDFVGTRVFVQNIPTSVSWQTLKDHFKDALNTDDVVYASVSIDNNGQSKGHGIVQLATTNLAQRAMNELRNFPLQGETLLVRADRQQSRGDDNKTLKKKGPTPPSKWKCANDDDDLASLDPPVDLRAIRALIKERDFARRRRNYDAADDIREQLKFDHAVHVDDRLQLWWVSLDGAAGGGGGAAGVPDMIHAIKGDGRWRSNHHQPAWRHIPTTAEYDATVNIDQVEALLRQRDQARLVKDFATADRLLDEARTLPSNDVTLRIHDESRTWRVWTPEKPPSVLTTGSSLISPGQQCLELVATHAPDKVDEVRRLLQAFPGREYNILKKLKQRYEPR